MHHPVSLEEIESVPMHTLAGASLYTLEKLNRIEDRMICLGIEWREQEIVSNGLKVLECSLAVSGVDHITVVHLIG